MRLPTYDDLIEEQRSVLETPIDEDLFVAGPPGSGKTVLAVQRARAAAELFNAPLLTYNRMLRRLMALLGAPITATAQSYVWHDYKRRTGQWPPRPTHDSHEYLWDDMLLALDGHEHSDYTADHAIVDEGQDLAVGFFTYARKHISPVLTVFADENQGVKRHTTLMQIQVAADLPKPILLTENHRNSAPIAALAEHFHGGRLPHARIRRTSTGHLPPYLRLKVGPAEMAHSIETAFRTWGGTVGVIVASNKLGSRVADALRLSLPTGSAIHHYTNNEQNEDLIDVTQPGITVVNVESVKGQEFDTVFVLQLEKFVPCGHDPLKRRKMYMMCTRARDRLFLIHGETLTPLALAELPETLVER